MEVWYYGVFMVVLHRLSDGGNVYENWVPRKLLVLQEIDNICMVFKKCSMSKVVIFNIIYVCGVISLFHIKTLCVWHISRNCTLWKSCANMWKLNVKRLPTCRAEDDILELMSVVTLLTSCVFEDALNQFITLT